MKICKEHQAASAVTEQDLSLINGFARRELTADEVYTFTVKLCDNDVDRDSERFSDECLHELAGLFTGKSGLLDHTWSAAGQLARIYRTEVITEEGKRNAVGEPYSYLKGWAYMLRNEETKSFIDAIDAGIVRETSVGCAVSSRKCSICGGDNCSHIPGREYGGELCHTVLSGATDAYEWSFVAVPAQKEAGVMKGATLKEFVKSGCGKAFQAELEALEKMARTGEALLMREREEVYRLGLLWDEQMAPSIKMASAHMNCEELIKLRGELEKKLSKSYPPVCQLPGKNISVRFDGDEYLI